jgi:hypothetical protein
MEGAMKKKMKLTKAQEKLRAQVDSAYLRFSERLQQAALRNPEAYGFPKDRVSEPQREEVLDSLEAAQNVIDAGGF